MRAYTYRSGILVHLETYVKKLLVLLAVVACSSSAPTGPVEVIPIPTSFVSYATLQQWGCNASQGYMMEEYAHNVGVLPDSGTTLCVVLARFGEPQWAPEEPTQWAGYGCIIRWHFPARSVPNRNVSIRETRIDIGRPLVYTPAETCGVAAVSLRAFYL